MKAALSRFLLAACFAVTAQTEAADQIATVRIGDGRQFRGRVDSRTDSHQLWVRSGSEYAYVLRPIPWKRVVAVTYQNREYGPLEFRNLAGAIKSTVADPQERKSVQRPSTEQSDVPRSNKLKAHSAEHGHGHHPSEKIRELSKTPGVQSVSIDARVANWDRDVETDGLLIYVRPLDGHGVIVPVRATLDVELIGVPRGRRSFAAGHLYKADQLTRLGRWTKRVWADDVGPHGAVLKLPFQVAHPEFDRTSGRFGLVHVRMTVAGDGVFEASQAAVLMRPFSPIRDAFERAAGRRFLPAERASIGRP